MTQLLHDVALSDLTTMRVGGPARDFMDAETPEELVAAAIRADRDGVRLFVLGGGSNVLVCDDGFDGLVARPAFSAVEVVERDARRAVVRAQAGCEWDALVARCVDAGLAGIEALSGIPGRIGSAVMQNVGAYGQEMGSCLREATLYDRLEGRVVSCGVEGLALGYRTSKLRRSLEEAVAGGGRWDPTPRWVVLDATFELLRSEDGTVCHPQLAGALSCEVGTSMPIAAIRRSVLEVRASKGMVVDDAQGDKPDHDRWSTGSFFTNPVLDRSVAESLPDEAPRYDAGGGGAVKTSAAWLIEHAGFHRGFGVQGQGSRATLSTRHTLALTNRGSASAADIVELARTVRDGVESAFGVRLVPETVTVGVTI